MIEKMTRRAFMKSVGTVAFAVAAVSALTACGGNDVPSQPTPVVPKPDEDKNETGLELSDMSVARATLEYKPCCTVLFKLKNTGTEKATISASTFGMKLDGADEQKAECIIFRNAKGAQRELAVGESEECRIFFYLSQEIYDTWMTTDREMELIVHNNDAKSSKKISLKKSR